MATTILILSFLILLISTTITSALSITHITYTDPQCNDNPQVYAFPTDTCISFPNAPSATFTITSSNKVLLCLFSTKDCSGVSLCTADEKDECNPTKTGSSLTTWPIAPTSTTGGQPPMITLTTYSDMECEENPIVRDYVSGQCMPEGSANSVLASLSANGGNATFCLFADNACTSNAECITFPTYTCEFNSNSGFMVTWKTPSSTSGSITSGTTSSPNILITLTNYNDIECEEVLSVFYAINGECTERFQSYGVIFTVNPYTNNVTGCEYDSVNCAGTPTLCETAPTFDCIIDGQNSYMAVWEYIGPTSTGNANTGTTGGSNTNGPTTGNTNTIGTTTSGGNNPIIKFTIYKDIECEEVTDSESFTSGLCYTGENESFKYTLNPVNNYTSICEYSSKDCTGDSFCEAIPTYDCLITGNSSSILVSFSYPSPSTTGPSDVAPSNVVIEKDYNNGKCTGVPGTTQWTVGKCYAIGDMSVIYDVAAGTTNICAYQNADCSGASSACQSFQNDKCVSIGDYSFTLSTSSYVEGGVGNSKERSATLPLAVAGLM